MPLIVNGERIDPARIEQQMAQLQRDPQFASFEPDPDKQAAELYALAKDHVITGLLINQEVGRRKMVVPRDEVDAEMAKRLGPDGGGRALPKAEENALRKNLELQIKIDRLLDSVCRDVPEPSDAEAKTYYETHQDEFAIPEQVHAAHIVKHVDAGNILEFSAAGNTLKEILDRLAAGEDFEALAQKYSDCPGAGVDLGFFAPGEMVEEFDAVVFALQPGQVSDIFSTRFGLHIAKVYARVPAQPRPFEEVREEVIQTLRTDMENERIDAFVEELKRRATIQDD